MRSKPKHKLYDDVYTLFVDYGMTCIAIADMLPISERTLSKWRIAMNWDKDREVTLARPDKIREILMTELKSVAEGNKPKIDTDALSKISKTLQYFDGKLSLPICVAVLKECDWFVVRIAPDKAMEITELHKAYLYDKAQDESLKVEMK